MTDRKDFKRVVRARARRTGESYSSALRNVRTARPNRPAAAAWKGNHQKEPPVNITRAIPDVRSTNIAKTVRFYTDLLGFDTRMDGDRVDAFVSTSHEGVEVILNRDGFVLPPGFTVEVESADDVVALFERSEPAGVRVIEPISERQSQFSVLDPAGRRVTITAAKPMRAANSSREANTPIARAIPGSVIEAAPAKLFYGDYLGFHLRHEWPEALMFESRSCPGAQVLAGASQSSPDSFDIDVGTRERVDAIHAAAVGNAVVMGAPEDFPKQGIRCFLLVDPNGVAINVLAHL